MRLAHVDAEREWAILVFCDEIQGVVHQDVRQRALELLLLAIDFERGIHRRIAAAEEAEEMVEAALGRMELGLHAQVPLADEPSDIAVTPQDLRERDAA